MGLSHSTRKIHANVVPRPRFNRHVVEPIPPKLTNPDKPNKLAGQQKNRITRDMRNAVWVKYHGDTTIGVCYCCGIFIQRYNAGWHCSHVIASNKGGPTTIENLRTCCKKCNLSMGNCNLYVYIKENHFKGPGSKNVNKYLRKHKSQVGDKRTNNWS